MHGGAFRLNDLADAERRAEAPRRKSTASLPLPRGSTHTPEVACLPVPSPDSGEFTGLQGNLAA